MTASTAFLRFSYLAAAFPASMLLTNIIYLYNAITFAIINSWSQISQTRRGGVSSSVEPELRRGISSLVRRSGIPARAPYRVGLLGWALYRRGAGINRRLDFGLAFSISDVERAATRSSGLRNCRGFGANLRSDSEGGRGRINLYPGWSSAGAVGSQRRWASDWAQRRSSGHPL
jgi:hypothetical protein